jgi:hypothetical protein
VFAGHRSSVGCSQGIVCQRITFVRELRWGVTFVFASYHHGHSSAWCLLGVVCLSGSYLCQRVASGSYLFVCMVPSWTLVSKVFTGCCLSGGYLCQRVASGSYLCVYIVSSWTLVSVVFAGCCLFVGKLPSSESCVRELPLCLLGVIVALCLLADSVVCQLLSQVRLYAHGGRPCGVFVCLFTLAG